MNKVMEVGNSLIDAPWEGSGEDSWKISPWRALDALLGMINLTLAVLGGEPLRVPEQGSWLLSFLLCVEKHCWSRLPCSSSWLIL